MKLLVWWGMTLNTHTHTHIYSLNSEMCYKGKAWGLWWGYILCVGDQKRHYCRITEKEQGWRVGRMVPGTGSHPIQDARKNERSPAQGWKRWVAWSRMWDGSRSRWHSQFRLARVFILPSTNHWSLTAEEGVCQINFKRDLSGWLVGGGLGNQGKRGNKIDRRKLL